MSQSITLKNICYNLRYNFASILLSLLLIPYFPFFITGHGPYLIFFIIPFKSHALIVCCCYMLYNVIVFSFYLYIISTWSKFLSDVVLKKKIKLRLNRRARFILHRTYGPELGKSKSISI